MVGLHREEKASLLGWRFQGGGWGVSARRALSQVGTEGHRESLRARMSLDSITELHPGPLTAGDTAEWKQ